MTMVAQNGHVGPKMEMYDYGGPERHVGSSTDMDDYGPYPYSNWNYGGLERTCTAQNGHG